MTETEVDADLSDRVVLITGATSGVGREAAVELGELGATVLVHGRDRERGAGVVDAIETAPGDGAATFLSADFADLGAVRDLATEVRERHDSLDILVNNAGLARNERRVHDLEGGRVEETFLVNHLAPYLLTHDLLGELRTADDARVVTTASTLHRRGDLELADLASENGGYDTMDAYARSKLANVLFAVELADRFDGSGVTSTAYHPGFVPGSRFYRDTAIYIRAAMRLAEVIPFAGRSVAAGGGGLARLAAAEGVAGLTGAYFDGYERVDPDSRAEDADRRERLWTVSGDLVGIDPDWP